MTQAPYRIVVALDLFDYAEIVLEHALDQAALRDATELHFVTVVGERDDIEAAKEKLAALALPGLDGLPTTAWSAQLHVRRGDAREEIPDLASELRAHLLVIGRFGLHHPHRSLALTANQIVERATCPTLVVGLSDQSPDAVAQCPACVQVRAETEGERWFCAEHTSEDRMRLSAIITKGTIEPSGLMW